MAAIQAKVEVIPGPVMRTALDVLDLVGDLLKLIPEEHEQERAELATRALTLGHMAMSHIKPTK